MRCFAVTNRGIEPYCAGEIEEFTGKKPETGEQLVFFDIELKKLYELYYFSQSANRIAVHLATFAYADEEDLLEKIKKVDITTPLLSKETSFFARMIQLSQTVLDAPGIDAALGERIIEATGAPVQAKKPDVVVVSVVQDGRCHIGLDLAGFDLSKRQYVLYPHREALKPTVAYALLRHAAVEKAKVILDPFCGTGTILIEAAHFLSNFSINYYLKEDFGFVKTDKENKKLLEQLDKKRKEPKQRMRGYDAQLGYVSQAQKNAKIGGVHKMIHFARADMDWIDTKCEKESVDCVVTHPPELSAANKGKMIKLYDRFFYQMEFVLAKKGSITLVTTTPAELKKSAERYAFACVHEQEVWQGKKQMWMMKFTRSA